MLISGRAATRRLQAAGLTERSAHLFDEGTVERLVDRRRVAWPQLRAACPHGLFLARRPGATPDLENGRPMSLAATFRVRHGIAQHGFFPLVATVAGFVSAGADIVGARGDVDAPAPPRTQLTLRPPGPWYDTFRDHRLPAGPGPSWLLLNVPGWISASGAA